MWNRTKAKEAEKNKYTRKTKRREGREEESKWEREKKEGKKNPCTCSSQLCCAYSETLLHPERLLSVSVGNQGFIAKEGGLLLVCICPYVGEEVVGGGRKVGVCGNSLWRGTWLPTWASINMSASFDPTHYTIIWWDRMFLWSWEGRGQVYNFHVDDECGGISVRSHSYKCACVLSVFRNRLESCALVHWGGKRWHMVCVFSSLC